MTFPLNSLSRQLMADADRVHELSWSAQIEQGEKIFQMSDIANMDTI